MTVASALAILLAGALIGATSIGGVLVVPVLTSLDGVALTQAIAASAFGFGFPAVAAFWAQRRRRDAGLRWALLGGALAGAVAGAFFVHAVSPRVLLVGVVAIVLFAGVRGLWATRRGVGALVEAAPLADAPLGALGVVVGVGSALTGTGGPVLLTPILLLLRQNPLRVVAAAQAVQLPIAMASTAVHLSSGALDLRLGALLGVLLLAGSLAGMFAVRYVSVIVLQRMVALLLVAVGLWYAWLAVK